MSKKRLMSLMAFVLGATAAAMSMADMPTGERNRLWLTISLKCMRHLAKAEAPLPCDSIENSLGWDRGVALLKDAVGVARMLAVPTHPVAGIEDPAVLADGEPNYFAVAWSEQYAFPIRLHAKASTNAVAVAVDAKAARAQDQLHLIVDCLDRDVVAALDAQAPKIDAQWRPMSVALKGRTYWARRVEAARPEEVWPFRLLADTMPEAKADMGAWSLALVRPASLGEGAFLLLADRAEGDRGGRARDLLDPDCAIVRR